MKYFISLALASTMLASVSAHAADIDSAPVVEKGHDWRGSYFGIQGGGIVSGDSEFFNILTPGTSNVTNDFTGGFGGILTGYNFQSGNIVFGIDSDLSFGDLESDFSGRPAAGGNGVAIPGVTAEINTLSTARVRVGYAFDRVLPYVTAGLAYGSVDFTVGAGQSSVDEFQFGWTAGAGIEYAATDYINMRVQYNYIDLGDNNYNFGAAGIANLELDNIHTIRAGISIKTAPLWNKILGR